MKRDESEASRYFQAVSRFFFEQRGAPFFLSSKEVENIRKWKNMGIPLQIVLEGIEDCFVTHRGKSGRKGKIFSLAFCHPFVLRSYGTFKERKVGGQRMPFPKEDKRKRLKNAVEQFLASCPQSFTDIRKIFSRVLELISQSIDEELLEELEDEVEALVVGMASETEKEQIRKEVEAEFGDKNFQEQGRIRELKLIKHIRKKYMIPHVSIYYY
jgi:hypothetical protein